MYLCSTFDSWSLDTRETPRGRGISFYYISRKDRASTFHSDKLIEIASIRWEQNGKKKSAITKYLQTSLQTDDENHLFFTIILMWVTAYSNFSVVSPKVLRHPCNILLMNWEYRKQNIALAGWGRYIFR